MDYEKQLRRLRKKLRQAQNLESFSQSLNQEELLKVSQISAYIEEINEILSRMPEESDELMKSNENALEVNNISISDFIMTRQSELESVSPPVTVSPTSTTNNTTSSSLPPAPLDSSCQSSSIAPTVKKKAAKKKKTATHSEKLKDFNLSFGVRDLLGHGDLVYCTDAVDDLLVTGSRDGIVKVWHVETGTLECSFASHTQSVTGVTILSRLESRQLLKEVFCLPFHDNDHVIISASHDCHIKMTVSPEGRELHSVYTFSPISCLSRLSLDEKNSGLIFLSTCSGRVELWKLWDNDNSNSDFNNGLRKDNLYGDIHFNASVVALQIRRRKPSDNDFVQYEVLCASENGSIKMLRFSYKEVCLEKEARGEGNNGESAAAGKENNQWICHQFYENHTLYQQTKANQVGRKRLQLNHLRAVLYLDNDHILVGDRSRFLKVINLLNNEVELVVNAAHSVGNCQCLNIIKKMEKQENNNSLEQLVICCSLDSNSGSDVIHLFRWCLRDVNNDSDQVVETRHSLDYVGSLLRGSGQRRRIMNITTMTILCNDSTKVFLATVGNDVTVWQTLKMSGDNNNKDDATAMASYAPRDVIMLKQLPQLKISYNDLVNNCDSSTDNDSETDDNSCDDEAVEDNETQCNSSSASVGNSSRCAIM